MILKDISRVLSREVVSVYTPPDNVRVPLPHPLPNLIGENFHFSVVGFAPLSP